MSSSEVDKHEEVTKTSSDDSLEDDEDEYLKEGVDLDSDQDSGDEIPFDATQASNPSTNVWGYWIICNDLSRRKSNAKEDGPAKEEIGKYLVFEDRKHIDASWEKIKTATEGGLLGFASKVSTKKEKPKEIGGGQNSHVICVYTKYTSTDDSDKRRVLQSLRNFGYQRHIPYKTDAATYAGIYSNKNQKDGIDETVETATPEYTAAVAGTSQGNVSNKRTDPDSDPERSDSYISKKFKSDFAPKRIEYVQMYTTKTPYSAKVFLHIKQVAPTSHSGQRDILFPMEQAVEVADSVYKLAHVVLKDDEDFIEGISTSHVKLWAGFSKDFKKSSVFIKSTKSNSMVSFPQTDAVFYYNRIEWYHKNRSF